MGAGSGPESQGMGPPSAPPVTCYLFNIRHLNEESLQQDSPRRVSPKGLRKASSDGIEVPGGAEPRPDPVLSTQQHGEKDVLDKFVSLCVFN